MSDREITEKIYDALEKGLAADGDLFISLIAGNIFVSDGEDQYCLVLMKEQQLSRQKAR